MPNKLSRFWQELKRRKVLPFLIGYIAACFAIIEFFLNATETFSLPEATIRLLYLLAAIGIPVVIILAWIIKRKQKDHVEDLILPWTGKEKTQHNLPVQLTSFIGREKEMQTVQKLISNQRLVTLTGAGGCGKTRLAIEVAFRQLKDFTDGVWFVDLAPITSGALVAKEIIETLKIKEVPNQSVIETLIDRIKNNNMLILLDNCEHLIKSCAENAIRLAQAAPRLKILATSREALSITGEYVWRVPSLTLIDLNTITNVEQARNSEAVMLFAERARMNNPEFELVDANVNEVVTICNKLDGIPLALELVASRTRHMNTQMILERFSDRFDQVSAADPRISSRQKTLYATIDWSYNLLSNNGKLLFVRLAVFSGGFDMEAAEHVCADKQLPRETILDMISRLVDQSMVYTIQGKDQSLRYNRLETLRQYAEQKLISQNEVEEIRDNHLQYYLRMAEEAHGGQFQSQLKWLNKLEQEHDNLIAALNWSDKHATEEFVRLSGSLAWFWSMHSHISTGLEYLERAINKDVSKSEAYARALFGLAMIVFYTGAIPRSIDLINKSLDIWRQLDNPRELSIVLCYLSAVLAVSGEPEAGLKYSLESVELARKIDNPALINYCLIDLSQSYIRSKQYDQAQPIIETFFDSISEHQQPDLILRARRFHGDCNLGQEKYDEAEKAYCRALETALKYGNMLDAAFELQCIALAASKQERWSKAIRLISAAREKASSLGTSLYGLIKSYDEMVDTCIGEAMEKLGEGLIKKYEEEGKNMGFEVAVEYALDIEKD